MHPADQRACIDGERSEHSGKWLFAKSYSCLFGIGSVAVSFNRLLALATAVSKRLGICMCAAYFDDLITLESLNFSASARSFFFLLVLSVMGAPPAPAKSFPLGQHRAWVGAALNLATLKDDLYFPSNQKNPLAHKWSKGVVRQSREVRSHRQKQPLSGDKPAGQQRYQQDVSGGLERTFSKPGSINHILKVPPCWMKTTPKLWNFWPFLVSAALPRAVFFFRQV